MLQPHGNSALPNSDIEVVGGYEVRCSITGRHENEGFERSPKENLPDFRGPFYVSTPQTL